MISLETCISVEAGAEQPAHLKRRTGAGMPIGHKNMLHFGQYFKAGSTVVPESYNAWKGKKPIPVHDWYNTEIGDCTIASQGESAEHMERLEQRKTITIDREEIKRVYFDLLKRVYNTSEDNGAFELDALNNWRNPDYTFRDVKGRPLTIDAFTKVNHTNFQEVQAALFTTPSKVIKVCFALPLAWLYEEGFVWDIPEGQKPIGNYRPYSWGGHSTAVLSNYNQKGVYVLSSWNTQPYFITWRAFAIYATEAYMVVDSVNGWKKVVPNKQFNLKALVSDVNAISDVKIAA